MKRAEAYLRLTQVRDEFAAIQFAAGYALDTWGDEDGAFTRAGSLTHTELNRARERLEITYVVRLFAAFEGVLKDFRERGLRRRPARIDMFDLMNSIATRIDVHPDILAAAHDVREFRNDIIHRDVRVVRLTLTECQRVIGKFCYRLPVQW